MVKNLHKLRKQKGLSQQKLAEKIGTSQQSIYKYETQNIEPDIATLKLLAAFFETSIDYLVGNTDIDHIIERIEPYDLNSDEAHLLKNYRNLKAREKVTIQTVISDLLNKN